MPFHYWNIASDFYTATMLAEFIFYFSTHGSAQPETFYTFHDCIHMLKRVLSSK